MVRQKNQEPSKNAPQNLKMSLEKCHSCDLVINRKGEKRPAVKCRDCKNNHCFLCAGLDAALCEMMRHAVKEFWACAKCEEKSADLKSVINSIQNIHTEISTIKKGQDEQQEERERVLEGLKVVQTVVKKIENIENVQASHGERLTEQETATKMNDEKIDQGLKRLEEVEEKLRKMDGETLNMRLTNAVVREVRDIEKKEKNFVLWNVPESTEEAAGDRKTNDENKVKDVFKELKTEDVAMKNVVRVGEKGGRHPRGILVIMKTITDCAKVMKFSESVQLANDVRIVPDRTFNQREEARLFRLEKEKEEREGLLPTTSAQGGVGRGRGRGRGRGKGPGRPKGSGRGGGRGGSVVGFRADSRKRALSGDGTRESEVEDEENKRRKIRELTPDANQKTPSEPEEAASVPPSSAPKGAVAAQTQAPLQAVRGRPGTPNPAPRVTARADDDDSNHNF